MKMILIAFLGGSLLGSGKELPPYPVLPKEGNATLSFEGTSVTDFIFIPDGEKCGGAQPIPPELDPIRREDKTFVLEGGKRSALEFVWVSKSYGACWLILSANPVPDGRYRLDTGGKNKPCNAQIVPLDEKSAQGFEVWRMKWKGFKVPSECKRVK